MSQGTRAYLYRVGAATLPLLVLLGVVTQEIAAEIYIILGAALAVGEAGMLLAAKNTPTSDVGGAAAR